MSSTHDCLPYFAEGTVVSGFGRGSRELGIPTANFPEDVIRSLPPDFECGVYYGWAKVSNSATVHKMTMCVGWNPYYHNTVKTMETHLIHKFDRDFYGCHLKIIVLGFIRPMCDFDSLDSLIAAIHKDISVASQRLESADCQRYKEHPFFLAPPPSLPVGQSSTAVMVRGSGANPSSSQVEEMSNKQNGFHSETHALHAANENYSKHAERNGPVFSKSSSKNPDSFILNGVVGGELGSENCGIKISKCNGSESERTNEESHNLPLGCIQEISKNECQGSQRHLVNGHVEQGEVQSCDNPASICKL